MSETSKPDKASALRAFLKSKGVRTSSGVQKIPRRGLAGPAPLSPAQERIWFHQQLAPASTYYNSPLYLGVVGTLRLDELARAFERLAARQSGLATTYEERGGLPVQIVRASWGGQITFEDLSGLPADGRREVVNRRAAFAGALPFDIVNGPVLRVHAIKRGDDDHLLVVTMHHITFDAWSLGPLFDDLAELYRAELEGRPAELRPLEVEYADFAVWQREWLTSSEARQHLDFWRAYLDGTGELLRLPFDRPHPGTPTGPSQGYVWILPTPAVGALRELCSREGASSFMVLTTAMLAMLSRYTSQRDLVVVSPIAARTHAELEPLIGFFVNTLPIRVRLDDRMTLRDLLRAVKRASLDAFAHQALPFDVIVKELGGGRSATDTPLANVLLVGGGAPMRLPELPGLEISMEAPEDLAHDAHFPLTFGFEDAGATIGIELMFRADLFDASTVKRMFGLFDRILEVLLSEPDRALDAVGVMTAGERAHLVDELNRTPSHRGTASLAHALFERQVVRTPDAVAVAARDDVWTYAELNQRARALAEQLRERGIGPDDAVAIYLPRGLAVAQAVLGTMMAGGACVPLDPSYPTERLRAMLDDSRARVVIGQAGFGSPELLAGREVVVLDPTASRDRPAPEIEVRGPNLCALLFTSGSTGRPKGIGIPHAALTNFIHWQVEILGLEGPATTLQVASLGFDTAFEEMFTAWATGSRLEMVDEETRKDPQALADLLIERRVRRWLTSYVSLQQVAELLHRRGVRPPALEVIICSGEALRMTSAIRWLCATEVRLINQYGPTETLVVTAFEVDVASGLDAPPIGTPISGCATYVLARELDVLPLGFEGDLYVGGVQLARGYLDRPAMTAERFVPDPFGRPGGRLYRTGDRARVLADGKLQFLGRDDDQVKIRGNRVELGEVEAALLRCPGVAAACVAIERVEGGDRLVAVAVPIDGATVEGAALRAQLAATLPGFAVPSRIVVVSAMPKTPNGKADRKAVAALAAGGEANVGPGFEPPRTDGERRVAAVFAAVCGDRPIGRRDSFFDVGGDSIRAVRATSMLGVEYGRAVPIRLLFTEPTVERLAAALGEPTRTGGEARPMREAIPRRDDSTAYPVTFQVEEFVRLHQHEETVVDHLAWSTWIDGPFDSQALVRALALVVARHAGLRARAAVRGDGRVVQTLGPPPPIPLLELDESAAVAFARAEYLRRFELETEGPMRVAIVRVGERRHLLSLVLHHVAIDGSGLAIFENELWGVYHQIVGGAPIDLPRLISDIFDRAAWQRAFVASPIVAAEWEFWRRRMADARPAEMPIDRPRTRAPYEGGLALNASVAIDCDPVSLRGRGSLYPLLLSALAWTLRGETQEDRLTIMSSFNHRDRPGAKDVIALLASQLLMPIDLRGERDIRALPDKMTDMFSAALDHPDLPLWRPLSPWLGPADMAPLFPMELFRVNLNYVRGRAVEETTRFRLTPLDLEVPQLIRPELMLFCANDDGVLSASLQGKSTLFEQATLDRMAAKLSEAIATLLG